MSIARFSFFTITCSGCEKTYKSDVSTMEAAVAEWKKFGWFIDGKRDICPLCCHQKAMREFIPCPIECVQCGHTVSGLKGVCPCCDNNLDKQGLEGN